MQKLRNFIMIMFLLIPTFAYTTTVSNTNVVQAKSSKHKSKTHNAKSVKKIKIGQVYWHPYADEYIKLLDSQNYASVVLNNGPKGAFDDGELYYLEFYKGKYTRKGNQYVLHMKTNEYTSISFIDMKRFKRKQYSYSEGPDGDYTSIGDKSHKMIMYPKKGKYRIESYFKGKRPMGSCLLEYSSNNIRDIKGSTFPNNAQEFLQQFTYISRDRVRDLSSKGK